jgi:CRISPR/Cas system-associated exonuclease Cas4 (RecB family)
MRATATQLVTFWTCPFLWHVSYEIKEPLPVWGTRRRFGNVIHAAIAEYERHGRSLEKALVLLEEQRAGLMVEDLEEARSILVWRHERAQGREGRPILIEGSLRAQLDGHRLEVRMDRLDGVGGDYLLAEYKGGKTVDLELVRVQLMILAYAILDVFGRAPCRWEIELLRARKVVSLPAEIDPGKLRDFTGSLIKGILEGDREPRPYDPAFCKRCPARSHCPKATTHPKPFTRVEEAKRETQRLLF